MLTRLLTEFTDEFKEYQSHDLVNAFVIICGMIHCRTVCLYKLRGFVGRYLGNTDVQLSSHYKRMTRFFCDHREGDLWRLFLRQGISLFRLKVNYLILDGTKWKVGERNYHFQTLSMIYKGVSIPIAWIDLEKMGSSSEVERLELFRSAFDWCQLSGKTLIADREYVGSKWFNYLLDNNIDFVIRIRLGDYEAQVNQEEGPSYDELLAKAIRSQRSYSKQIKIGKYHFFFSVKRNRKEQPNDPYVILLSSKAMAREAYRIYEKRWQTEQCFRHLKSNGFDLEKIGLKDPNKVQLMMAMVVFSYCLSIHLGLANYHQVEIKTYPDGSRYPEISVFRLGLDLLDSLWTNAKEFFDLLIRLFKEANKTYLSKLSIHVQ